MVLLVLTAGLAAWCAHGYWARLGDEPWRTRYWAWLLQGLVFPIFIWSLFNIGFGERFPPIVPQIADAQNAKEPWLNLWVGWSLVGVVFVMIHWTALTYLWLLGFIGTHAQEKREFAATVLI